MNIRCIALGRQHETYIKEGIETFTKRISNYYEIQWVIIPPLKNVAALQSVELKKKEAEAVMKLIQKEDYLVALDEKGKSFTSLQFARHLQEKTDTGVKTISFLIGGAYGLHDSIISRANLVLSFSAFTFPHQLVRLILAEQVYRACTIQRNEKYHHS
jgi:23S rRNA (pseudouridine1915-N3)-methyltransferase